MLAAARVSEIVRAKNVGLLGGLRDVGKMRLWEISRAWEQILKKPGVPQTISLVSE